MGRGFVWVQAQGFAVLRDRAVKLPQVEQGLAEMKVSDGAIWPELDGGARSGDGRVEDGPGFLGQAATL